MYEVYDCLNLSSPFFVFGAARGTTYLTNCFFLMCLATFMFDGLHTSSRVVCS